MTVLPDRIAGPPAAAGPLSVPGSRRAQLQGAAVFVGLCLALAGLGAMLTSSAPALVPFILALAPAVIAFGLAWREGGGAVRRLVHSLTRRPAAARWYLVLLIPVGWALSVVAVAALLGEPTTGLFEQLTPAALLVPMVVFIPAVAEEVAWRGYALPRLMASMSPLAASVVLAIPWTVMHLVLQLPGGVNEGLAIWASVLTLFAYSVVLTWVFVGTGGSVLVTALVHTGLNGVVPLMWGVDADLSWALRASLAAAVAVIVIALGGFGRRAGIS